MLTFWIGQKRAATTEKRPSKFTQVVRRRIAGDSITTISTALGINRITVAQMGKHFTECVGLGFGGLRMMAAGLSYREVGEFIRRELQNGKTWSV